MLSVQSYIEQFVGSGEDPERIIDQAVEDMNTDLVKLRQTAAQVTYYFNATLFTRLLWRWMTYYMVADLCSEPVFVCILFV